MYCFLSVHNDLVSSQKVQTTIFLRLKSKNIVLYYVMTTIFVPTNGIDQKY